jgi:D-3-phosphoglycerate dehydrogenase
MTNVKKVLVTIPFQPDLIAGFDTYLDKLREKGFEVILDPRYRKLTEAELVEQLPGVYAHVVSAETITEKVIRAADSLKVISRMGVGYDQVDVQAATKNGVAVTITPGANAEAVAEYTLALMMALARKVIHIDRMARDGVWKSCFDTSLYRETLGIIGLGNIGRQVAKLVSGFHMKILAYDEFQDKVYAQKHNITYCSLDDLLKESDFVTIHAPLNENTRNMLSEREFLLMKPSALIINCARGGIINEAALYEALKNKNLAGAALDVFENEPLQKDNPLLILDNVIVSTHTAGITYKGRGKVIEMAIQNVMDIAEGKIPSGTVNLEVFSNLNC